ncbi:unnamed protein product [Urochloa humidicola]
MKETAGEGRRGSRERRRRSSRGSSTTATDRRSCASSAGGRGEDHHPKAAGSRRRSSPSAQGGGLAVDGGGAGQRARTTEESADPSRRRPSSISAASSTAAAGPSAGEPLPARHGPVPPASKATCRLAPGGRWMKQRRATAMNRSCCRCRRAGEAAPRPCSYAAAAPEPAAAVSPRWRWCFIPSHRYPDGPPPAAAAEVDLRRPWRRGGHRS